MLLILIHTVAEYLGESLALLANSFFFYYLLTEKQRELQEYRNMLLLNCLIDYFCLGVQILNQPRFEVVDQWYVQILSGLVPYFPRWLQVVCVGLYSFELSLNAFALTLQFFFRYQLICRNRHLSLCELCKLLVCCFAFGSFFSFTYGSCFVEVDYGHFDFSLLKANPLIFGDAEPNGQRVLIGRLNSPISRFMFVLTGIASIQVVFVIFFLTWHTFNAMDQMREKMQPKTRALHKQINLLLFVQTSIIFFITLLPQLVYSVGLLFNMAGPAFGTLESTLLAFNQCVNPLCTLTLVRHYRHRFLVSLGMRRKESRVCPGPSQYLSSIA